MVQINFAQKTVNVKIVYYGPGMSGKTTNLEVVHQRAPESNRGELTSISTDGDRTLFFDYMPLELGTVAGMRTCFQLYTVPGQVYYNSTRKLVLQGVDGVIFIADSSASMTEQNLESLKNLEENLNEYGKDLSTMPHVIQWNKRDLPDALPAEELSKTLNKHGAPTFDAVANSGQGVFPTLKALAANVLKSIMQETAEGQRIQQPSKPGQAPVGGGMSLDPAGAGPGLSASIPPAPAMPTPQSVSPLSIQGNPYADPLAPAKGPAGVPAISLPNVTPAPTAMPSAAAATPVPAPGHRAPAMGAQQVAKGGPGAIMNAPAATTRTRPKKGGQKQRPRGRAQGQGRRPAPPQPKPRAKSRVVTTVMFILFAAIAGAGAAWAVLKLG